MKGEKLKILLIEDNDDHAELVIRSFENNRITNHLDRVSDGEEALNFLQRKGKYSESKDPLPHLILLDLRLPKVDGLNVLKQIKKDPITQMIPVVVLTSSNSQTDIEKSYSNYVNSYLVKPLDFKQFNKLMEDLGYYWLIWNKQPSHQSK